MLFEIIVDIILKETLRPSSVTESEASTNCKVPKIKSMIEKGSLFSEKGIHHDPEISSQSEMIGPSRSALRKSFKTPSIFVSSLW